MKTLKTLAKLTHEIPEDFRTWFKLLATNNSEKYDRGKYNAQILGKEIKEHPHTIIWGAKRYDADGAYVQLYCIDERFVEKSLLSRWNEIKEKWLAEINIS